MTIDESQHGITLRALRCSAKPPLRQAALAEKLGVKPSTISMIERGARGISVPMLKRIADVLACYLPMTAEEIAIIILKCEGVPE